jgi:hypothetical protein
VSSNAEWWWCWRCVYATVRGSGDCDGRSNQLFAVCVLDNELLILLCGRAHASTQLLLC